MYIFTITATEKSKAWFNEHKLDVKAIGAALTLLIAEVHPIVHVRATTITCKVSYNSEESGYAYKTNKIYLCDVPYNKGDSLAKKQREIFDHFLHEFRHWMHAKVYKLGIREISYTPEDVLNNTNAYYRNRLEIDARQFVRQYLTKFCKYYNTYAKIY
jgi:hypothetical protein